MTIKKHKTQNTQFIVIYIIYILSRLYSTGWIRFVNAQTCVYSITGLCLTNSRSIIILVHPFLPSQPCI